MPDNTKDEKSTQASSGKKSDMTDLPAGGKDLASKEADNVKGGRMRSEPEVTKNDTSDMYA